jgi:16S rRNA (guanine966-N2)-methyltransferase
LRVISGKYRGKNLVAPEGKDVRPTIDRVKESIFNVIQFGVMNSKFIDLFAGTGSMGIEAISRGASETIFSDISKTSLDFVKYNLKGIDGNYKILNRDYRETLNSIQGSVDYIFVDAPFALDCINEICLIVGKRKLIDKSGYIIYEHDIERNYTLSQEFYIEKSKTFGKIQVDFIKLANKVCAVTGSFDPITKGHLDIIEKALNEYDKVVVVIAQNETKKSLFTLEQRKEIVQKAVFNYPNVLVDICDGYIFKYLNEHKIDIIVRGYRNDTDYAYEIDMAKYNKEHGNIETILYKAKDEKADISSTKVRQALINNENIKDLVPKCVYNIIVKLYKENQ